MNFQEYQDLAKRTDANLGTLRENLIHMSLGMNTEQAELADVLKKNLAYGKDVDYVNLKEELGDIMWYIANFCNHLDWKLEDVCQLNITKLQKRFPNNFTQIAANNRDLTAERELLEKGL